MSRLTKKKLYFSVAFLALALLPLQTFAGSYDVFVGYADNLRASPFFPTPFFGSAGVALFAGQDPNAFQLDAGALMIRNTGLVPITVNNLLVTMRPDLGGGFPLNP